jgi:hypothetical protein
VDIQRLDLARRARTSDVRPGDALRDHAGDADGQGCVHEVAGAGHPQSGIGPYISPGQVGQLMHHHLRTGSGHHLAHPRGIPHVTADDGGTPLDQICR